MVLTQEELLSLVEVKNRSPHQLLGLHELGDGKGLVARALLPDAAKVELQPVLEKDKPAIELKRIAKTDVFEGANAEAQRVYSYDLVITDKSGNVWIVNNSAGNAVEYKHGGTTPIATLNIGSANAVSCSVDPTTGNLAATFLDTYGSGQGYVAIFTHAKGSPKYYMDSEMYAVYFCGYDDKGNLFVDGDQNGRSTAFQFAEIPRGKKTFTNITLKGATINFPGNVQWDGKHVAVGDQLYQDYPELGAIYQTTGAGGKIIGKTVLNDYGDIEGFWVEGKTVIGPDFCINGCTQGSSVGFFKYPAGGKPTKTFAGGFKSYSQPAGAAVSQ